MDNPLAHSADPEEGIPAQPYRAHVRNVVQFARDNAQAAGRRGPAPAQAFVDSVTRAAVYHDLGKLEAENQRILSGAERRRHLPVNHVDAGVAYLLREGAPLAATLVYAHHRGLPDLQRERTRSPGKALRDASASDGAEPTKQRTDRNLACYLSEHRSTVSEAVGAPAVTQRIESPDSILFRIGLSCLVDADHRDTARTYSAAAETESAPLRAEERLKALNRYVEGLGHGKADERTRLRTDIYRSCLQRRTKDRMLACDSPVGTGKTTAVMAHMLRTAAERRLRRIFVVLPYTNIIDQSVEVYRKALVLPGERPETIVAAHHHRADFEDKESRRFAFLWNPPFVVTTAVQFFETLAAATPAALRKLHRLPGAGIFLDEAHAALPAQLWPVAWRWITKLSEDWDCHFVLGSGSLSRFWQFEEFSNPPAELPDLVPRDTAARADQGETQRIRYRRRREAMTDIELVSWLGALPGPRLLILNTVQSAAAIANMLRETGGPEAVEHLSTALCPRDRRRTLERVKKRLRNGANRNWTLVATSCVEAGVDVSFATGLRERCSLNSLIQIGGRVNREGAGPRADIWDFQLKHRPPLVRHPAFDISGQILGQLFDEGDVGSGAVTEAMRREVRSQGLKSVARRLKSHDAALKFPDVEDNFVVIDSDTVTAIVDRELVERIERGEKVTPNEFQEASVQIWRYRADDYGLEPLPGFRDVFRWTLDYDEFLGYMAGVLPVVEHQQRGTVI